MWLIISIVVVIVVIAVLRVQEKNKSEEDARLLKNIFENNASNISLATSYTFDIVGEQSYQANLKKIAGKKEIKSKFFECYAKVSSEPFNKYDKNAVKVEINGLLVGYLNKNEASKLSGTVVNKTVPAVVNGGWLDDDSEGSYGVKLAINNIHDLV